MSKIHLLIIIMIVGIGCRRDKNNISGKVLNHDGTSSTSVVEVEGREKSNTISKSNGDFEIENLKDGSYKVKFTTRNPDGSFSSRTQELTVGSDGVIVKLPNPVILYTPALQATLSKDMVHLSWSKSLAEDFREYKIYRHTSSALDETTGTLIHVATSANDTTFIDEINHGDKYYYRVFVLNEYGLLGGSNIESIEGAIIQNDPLIVLGADNNYFLNKGETQWFNFSVTKGTLYKVTWKDAWFTPYTATGLNLGAYRQNQQNYYFYPEMLIQMTGGPRAFVASGDETAYLKVYGNDSESNGTYYVKVDTMNRTTAELMNINTDYAASLNIEDSKMYCFNAMKDSTYKVIYYGNFSGGAGDGLSVQLTCYSGSNGNTYINRDYVSYPQYADTVLVTSQATEKIYIGLTSVFFGIPFTTVNIKVVK